MDATKLHYLHGMGIQAWQLKNPPPASPLLATNPAWATLRTCVSQCTACGLDKTRTQTVFGVGNPEAELMIIGEAPGFHEDQQGEPFVGPVGQLLGAMLETIGQARSTVYIANILKCRPPTNRDPLVEEVNACTSFLTQQIALVQPKLIVAVGRIAAHYLLNTKTALGQLRNKLHHYGELNTPLIVTYHPADLLLNPADKSKAWEDLQFIQRTLQ
jgi:DNA polymerase